MRNRGRRSRVKLVKTSSSLRSFPALLLSRAAGWTSSGLLLAAGVVGAVRAYDLMSAGHEFRDQNNIGEEDIGPICYDEIALL